MAVVGSSTQTPLEHLRTQEHLTSQEVQQDVGLTQKNTTKDGVCCAHCNSNMSADHQPRERRDSDTSHKAKSFFITDILGTDFGTNCRSDDTEDNRSAETSPPVNHEPYSAVLHTHPDYKEHFDRFRLTFDSNASALLRNYSQIPHQIPLIRPAPVFPLIQAPSRLFHGTHAAFGCYREQRHNNLLIREIADTEDDEIHTDGSQSPDPELKHSSIPLPRRLQELVQRDPKRQRILHLQDTANSQYREYGQDFPVGFPGKSVAGSASSRGLNTEGGWPAWVYCTRYSDRPTAGPRTRKMKRPRSEEPETREQKEIPECKKRENVDDGAGSAPDNKRPRTAFTDSQLMRLREEFQKNHYLTEDRRKGLAWELGLGETQVKIWFQNKRAKIKKNSDYKTTLAEELLAQGLYNHSMQ